MPTPARSTSSRSRTARHCARGSPRPRCCTGSQRASGGRLRVARTTADLDGDGVVAVLHLEGAEPIGTALHELEVLHAAGLRSLGLVWSRRNAFATGVPFGFPGSPDQGPGLTDAGRALVRACGELGIVIDLSHLNERGFWEVADLSDAPLVASHSNAHVLCASPRNLTDDQLRAIGERGGLVGINFFPGFLRADGAEDPGDADHADRGARGARRAGRRARVRRPRLGLRRRDDAVRTARRDRPAGAARHAAQRRLHRRRAGGDRLRELAPGAGRDLGRLDPPGVARGLLGGLELALDEVEPAVPEARVGEVDPDDLPELLGRREPPADSSSR